MGAPEKISCESGEMHEGATAFPLSFAQQQVWCGDDCFSESPCHNLLGGISLGGALQLGPLHKALAALLHRHEALRTRFECRHGVPFQVPEPEVAWRLGLVDLLQVAPSDRRALVEEYSRAEGIRSFDLGSAPLLRARLLRLDHDQHVLLLTTHRIVSDERSMAIFLHEMSMLYSAFRQGKPASLPSINIQYADYAAWQREWLTGDILREHVEYWTNQMRGAQIQSGPFKTPQASFLPFYPASTESLQLDEDLTLQLREVCRRHKVTIFMATLAAMYMLLRRASGQSDISIASPVDCRTRTELEGVIGPFVNILPLRIDLPDTATFRDVLQRVREVCVGSYKHQDFPPELSLTSPHPGFASGRNVLPRVRFALRGAPVPAPAFDGLEMMNFVRRSGLTFFWQEWTVFDGANRLGIEVTCRTDIFKRENIIRTMADYETVLGELASTLKGDIIAEAEDSASVPHVFPSTAKTITTSTVSYAVRELEDPQSALEKLVAAVWEDLLKAGKVGRHSNFFELGGHSLLAVQLMHRMRELGLCVDVPTIFASPTVAKLSAALCPREEAADYFSKGIPADCAMIQPEMLPLVQLTHKEIDAVVSTVPGGAANVQDIYPLAPMQAGILFHHLLHRDNDPYLLVAQYSFDGRSRLNNYLAALQGVIDRHDILRTGVVWEGVPEPLQVVWRKAQLQVEEAGFEPGTCPPNDVRFDRMRFRIGIQQAPLLKVYVTEQRNSRHWLMTLLLHHLVGDHTTLKAMHGEVEAFLLGRQSSLSPPVPFSHFVAKTRLALTQNDDEAFFRQMLRGVEETTAPFGFVDARGDEVEIKAAQLELEEGLAVRIRANARRLNASAASLFHLVWARVLSALCGREDVVFGTVLFGRMQGAESEGSAIGLFINTLPMRIGVGQDGTVSAVRRTHTLLADLLRHEHAPLALAQRCSAVPPPAPLFSTLLNYRHLSRWTEASGAENHAWEGIQELRREERTHYPFTLSVNDQGSGFSLDARTPASIEPMRICEYMQVALESLAEALEKEPGRPLGDIQVLPTGERQKILYDWNEANAEYASDRCVHELFEEQACNVSDKIAAVFEEQCLTYRELNRQANRVASQLRKFGVKPDARVALCMERSLEMIVAVLGVLKAGGAYVPLDPAYPQNRLRYMLEDCEPAAVITQDRVKHLLGELGHGVAVLELSGTPATCERVCEENPGRSEIALQGRHLAYIIYTSGSTGQPKGVMVEHRNIVQLFTAMEPYFQFGVDDVWTLFHSYAFDFSVWEMFGALLYGGRLAVIPKELSGSPEHFYELLCRAGVTVLNQTPGAFLQLMAAQTKSNESHQLRYVIFGGEALEVSTLRPWYEQNHSARTRLINMYGITETTVHVTYRPLDTADCERPGTSASPIGRPIPGLRVYILDGEGEPVPVGVVGELYIGGLGVSRGYWKRAGLTTEKFVADPFAAEPGRRIYRTGDLGRWLPDGNIEFAGRRDFQVKIRGFRIELGEIETRLSQHPAVREAVVLAREDAPGEKRLVAYCTFRPEMDTGNMDAMQLRACVAHSLPEYMVPAAYVALKSMPLTENGKLDRKALPAPNMESFAGQGHAFPQSPLEELLCKMWEDLLNIQPVCTDQNFFEIGGHSLLATQAVSRMRAAFNVDLTLRHLYDKPTVAGIADTVLQLQIEQADPATVAGLLASLKYLSSEQVGDQLKDYKDTVI